MTVVNQQNELIKQNNPALTILQPLNLYRW